MPPHDADAEQAVLGSMILDRNAILKVCEITEGRDFYKPAHETIYDAILTLSTRGEPVDPITLGEFLTKRGDLNRVGGTPYLHALGRAVPTVAHAEPYAEIVRSCAVRRRALEALTRGEATIRGGTGDLDTMLGTVREEVMAATDPDAARLGGDTTGWEFSDLSAVLDGSHKPLTPIVGARDDGIGLFYPGRVNGIQGESEAGKSWIALIAALTEINRGNLVVYIDFEDSEEGIVSRLLLIGAAPQDIRERFLYVRPGSTPVGGDLQAFINRIDSIKPTLIVVDGVTEAMTMLGLELKENSEIAKFGRMLLRPLADTGAAVVPLDHVVKNNESRGRYALGGVHKLNGVDGVQYMLEAVQPFGINTEGRSRLRIAKDRPAQVRKHALPGGKNPMHWFADLVIRSRSDQFAEAHLYPPIQKPDDPAEMTAEEEKAAKEEAEIKERAEAVLAALAKAAGPLSKTSLEELVQGRTSVTRRAITRLVHDGRVEVAEGPRKAVLHSLPSRVETTS
ncbi:DnaB-like helicase N-terminal domain-containing protein [Streptomyces klenkii]|uniref:DnaB-like helicase N-terminal domain-containing protein n=1 Tax=Streptomyces klenkii TaxID=1420899 RepID=UPI0033AB1524